MGCVCNSDETYNGKKCKSICRQQKQMVDWSRSFDKWGWSVCPTKWLLTGLRTDGGGDALYSLEMAKCCQVKRSIWTRCQWTPINQAAFQSGRHTAEVQGTKAFIAGFYRTKQHSLGGLTYFYQCEPHFYGAEQR